MFHPGEDEFTGWSGDTPYFLVINTVDPKESLYIDLDEPGWMSERQGLMRAEAEWVLAAKRTNDSIDGVPVVAMRVLPGEQPYYTHRHVGIVYPVGVEVQCYGIGKKRLDGHVDRLWILPNGIVCPGDDVDIIGSNIARLAADANRVF